MIARLAVLALLCAAQVHADVGPLPGADIFVLGEVHDNPAHHATQAGIVAQVQPKALVFEMLTPAQAAAAMTVDRTDADAIAAATDWADSGWPDFAMYAPIFAAAPGAAIVGAAVPRDDLMRAMTDGAAAVSTVPVPQLAKAQLAMLSQEQAEAHCGALPPEMLPGMVEAQRLRDAAFAGATLSAFDATGGPVVLITGTGHARTDVGVPAALRLARPDLTVWALGQTEGAAEAGAPFDAVAVTDATDRPDPCAVFTQ
ncbi:Haem-binding uptake, Tiki superfamily, ChaN [Loktanella atrilutea]|uniref:Haem-binding uptake, Tiki superfamily, ChaN n=1 Tax=Loktanella atrilutea TaxID=366533 RepID=A0A1M4ZVU3_LOKAT|nr:ChaN family lipoprotein [Loktanella atrilutea]SHF22104.1 Haem-binding uptake, Tiki superfamily, ChaN [Loktanella atrilutea]